jgi:lactoylglutathione lyase
MEPITPNIFEQPVPTIDHIALYVFDLKKSTTFYRNVMGFKQVPEPFKDNKHSWFDIGPNTRLHLIEGATEIREYNLNTHIAFSVKVLKEFTDNLDKLNVRYRNLKEYAKEPHIRPDGVKQVFFQDPDNFWIEVNDDRH